MPAPFPKTKVKALKAAILMHVSSGQTVRAFCRDNDIHFSIVYEWARTDEAFAGDLEKARLIGADALADEILEIAEEPEEGEETEEGFGPMGRTSKTKRGDMLGHRKLKIYARLQLLAKWHPTKYGDKPAEKNPAGNNDSISVEIVPPDPVDE